ncbi:MAG: hypothetical protein ACPIOQ_03010 [Promethearchaeia archaeon]
MRLNLTDPIPAPVNATPTVLWCRQSSVPGVCFLRSAVTIAITSLSLTSSSAVPLSTLSDVASGIARLLYNFVENPRIQIRPVGDMLRRAAGFLGSASAAARNPVVVSSPAATRAAAAIYDKSPGSARVHRASAFADLASRSGAMLWGGAR